MENRLDIDAQKQAIRRAYLKIRHDIDGKAAKSALITRRVLADADYRQASVVALYKSMRSEVSTEALTECALAAGKTVVLPRVQGEEIVFYRVERGEELEKSAFGVEEPAADASRRVAKEEIDLIIVPGLCFDRQKNRMGFGRGYYDRFLAGSGLKSIGLCFERQLLPEGLLPVGENDVAVHKLITEAGTYA